MREFMTIVENAELDGLKAKISAGGWKSLSAEDKNLFATLSKASLRSAAVNEPPTAPISPLADLLNQWAEGYDAEDVWTGNRMAFDKEIIEACADLNHTVTGMLYRGQGVRATSSTRSRRVPLRPIRPRRCSPVGPRARRLRAGSRMWPMRTTE